tara:strand:+ start:134 stop:505 length:372 start_codon:yes stop_codon:yes gene_type:complete
MGEDKDYTITITNPSEDIGGWDSNITINGMSYSAPSIDMISTSTVDLNTESYVSDTGGEYTFNMPSNEIFVDSMPSVHRIQEMCELYPALAKAYEQFKLIYKMTEQDYKGKLKERGIDDDIPF